MRNTYLKMIKKMPGGWGEMLGALGMSRAALENRIYERHSQKVSVNLAQRMQDISETTLFAEGVAQEAGGCFLKLPESSVVDREDLLQKFNALYVQLGELSSAFRDAVANNEVDKGEKTGLEDIGQEICRTVQEILALTFLIYCERDEGGEEGKG